MHAGHHHWMLHALAVTVLFVAGCRGGRPLSRLVRVTNNPGADVPEIESPPQRLATAKSRDELGGLEKDPTREQASETDPQVRLASNESVDPNTEVGGAEAMAGTTGSKAADAAIDRIRASLASAKDAKGSNQAREESSPREENSSSAERVSAAKRVQDRPSSQSAKEKAAVGRDSRQSLASGKSRESGATRPQSHDAETAKTKPELATSRLPKVDQSPLVDAFSSSSPEVQELALRQLIAMAAKNAENSDSPHSIDQSLTDAIATVARSGDASPDRPTPASAESQPKLAGTALEKKSAKSDTEASDSIRTVSATHVGDEPSGISQAANHATNGSIESAVEQVSAALLSDKALFSMLMSRLRKPVPGETEADRARREIMVRHLMVLAGDPDEAVTNIKSLSEKEQQYLRHQLLALWTVIDPEGHPVPARRFGTALPQLREATKYLAASTDSLEVRSLAFCTEVLDYGMITEFDENAFQAGQQIILYSEIDCFTTKQLERGYETHLQGSYNIYDGENRKIISQLLPADKQTTRNFLRDYFIAYQMYLPKQLANGKYRLELTMEDVAGSKYGQSSIDFEIVD